MRKVSKLLVILKILKNEETRERTITIIICSVMLAMILITSVVSIPTVIIAGVFDEDTEDMEKVLIYQDTIFVVDNMNKEWIEEMKEAYSYCDEFEIIYNYNLTWYELISIDSVLLNQDFRKMDSKKIQDIALKFLIRTVEVIEKEVEEEYEKTNTLEDGTTETVTNTRIVIKKIAVIRIDTKNYEDVFPDVNIIDEEDILLALNIYNTISNMNIEGNLNIYDNPQINIDDLQEYPEGYANLPYYNQTDKRWGANSYGNTTISDGGCGPTSLAMIVAGLTNNKVTPLDVANWSYANGHRAEGQGSYWSLMTSGGSNYGLNVESVSRKDPNSITKALSEGHPVIVSMGKGHFTKGGHFVVLRGITADGKILVHDSASVARSNKEWDLNIIMNESSQNGGASGSPFWIFRP